MFGFVTKLLIPTVSVIKISKEKTAKIIPNAVGVATANERHVFGSFMSREAAFRLMLSVWRPIAPIEPTVVQKLPDVEISECSIEEDSSSAISGNESPPRGVQESTTSTDASNSLRHRVGAHVTTANISTLVEHNNQIATHDLKNVEHNQFHDIEPTLPSRSTSPPPKIISICRFHQIKFSKNFLYIGIILSFLLAILSVFLLYRIMNHQSRTMHASPIDIKWVSVQIPLLLNY